MTIVKLVCQCAGVARQKVLFLLSAIMISAVPVLGEIIVAGPVTPSDPTEWTSSTDLQIGNGVTAASVTVNGEDLTLRYLTMAPGPVEYDHMDAFLIINNNAVVTLLDGLYIKDALSSSRIQSDGTGTLRLSGTVTFENFSASFITNGTVAYELFGNGYLHNMIVFDRLAIMDGGQLKYDNGEENELNSNVLRIQDGGTLTLSGAGTSLIKPESGGGFLWEGGTIELKSGATCLTPDDGGFNLLNNGRKLYIDDYTTINASSAACEIGVSGTGSLELQSHSEITTIDTTVGGVGTGSVILSGSTWNCNGALTVNQGSITLNESSTLTSGETKMGDSTTHTSSVIINSSRWDIGNSTDGWKDLSIGSLGNASLTVTNDGWASTEVNCANARIASSGSAVLTISGNSDISTSIMTCYRGMDVGYGGTLAGTLNLEANGILKISGHYFDVDSEVGTFNWTGGTLSLANGATATGIGNRIAEGCTLILNESNHNFGSGGLTLNGKLQAYGTMSEQATVSVAGAMTIGSAAALELSYATLEINNGGSLSMSTDSTIATDSEWKLNGALGSMGNANLSIGQAGSSRTGTLTVTNSGALDNIGALTVYNGDVNVNAGGTLTSASAAISGSSTHQGNVTVIGTNSVWSVGDLDLSGESSSYRGTLEVTGGGRLRVSGAFTQTTDHGNFQLYNGGILELHDGGTFDLLENSISSYTLEMNNSSHNFGANDFTVADSQATYDSKVVIKNGGSISNANGIIGDSNSFAGEVIVRNSGSAWNNSGNLTIGVAGTASLTVENGGYVNSIGTTTVGSTGVVNLFVDSSQNMLASGQFTNNGTVNVYAGRALAGGTYSPVTATSGFDGSGSYNTYGGYLDSQTHQFIVSNTEVGGVTAENLSWRRLFVADSTVLASFGTYGVRDDSFNAFTLDITDIGGYNVLNATSFTTTLEAGDVVLLSFEVSETDVDNLALWHRNDMASEWELVSGAQFDLVNGWASFSVNHFSDYAITGAAVPEPATVSLLLIGSAALLLRKKR